MPDHARDRPVLEKVRAVNQTPLQPFRTIVEHQAQIKLCSAGLDIDRRQIAIGLHR